MKILLAMMEPPLPFGNAAARWYYVLLKGLVERGHQVRAFATCSNPADIEKSKKLFPEPKYDLKIFPHAHAKKSLLKKLDTLRRPYSYMISPEMKREFDQAAKQGFDVLHLEQLWMGWLGIEHSRKALLNIHHHIAIDLAETPNQGLKDWAEKQLIFRTEARLLAKHRYFRACSPRLVELIRKTRPDGDVTVIPVGIDSSLYPFLSDEKRNTRPNITLIGSMQWYPSSSAAKRLLERLWPEIRRQVPEAELKIIGWSAKSVLAQFEGQPGLEILENVPDTKPYFENTGVFLYAPARGSGMKIKILEAMSFGIPVVTTSEGIEGLPAQDGIHAGIADDDAGLIRRAVTLLKSQTQQNTLRREARKLVEAHCSPQATLDAVEEVYRRIAACNPG